MEMTFTRSPSFFGWLLALLVIQLSLNSADGQYFNQQPLYFSNVNSQQAQQLQYLQQEPVYILQEEPTSGYPQQQQVYQAQQQQSRPAANQQKRRQYQPAPQQQLQQVARPRQQQQYRSQQQLQQPARSQAYNPLVSAQQLRPVVAAGPRQGGGGCKDQLPVEDPSQCDKYYACEDGAQVEKLCPDGLVFNPRVPRSRRKDPCYYPQEVECGSRSQLQPAQATDQCPHQFALFGTGDSVNCGQYVSCAHGVAYTLPCPPDLAFSDETGRCEWPDEVRTCDASAYLQFTCPAPSEEGALDRYPDANDCRKFFVCVDGLPRRITCGEDTVYNPETQTCDDPKNVQGCDNYYANQRRNAK